MRGLHWFRNDLRLQDNTALSALVAQVAEWLPVFVLDPRLTTGPHAGAARMRFLLDCLGHVARDLDERGVPLLVREGPPEQVLPKLMYETGARLLSFNEDVTPFARRRDDAVRQAVERGGGKVLARLDRVVFRSSEIRTVGGGAYSVYS
ncbi:MAG: deoxyribodipyrimidine photo-lyase, partial [Myxococcales bacterium]